MSRREDVVKEMAAALWTHAGGDTRRVPPGARQAAEDLAGLYEEDNGRALMDLVHRVRAGGGDTPGGLLALYALGAQDPPAGITAPAFEIEFDGDELTWDGEAGVQVNPARTNAGDIEVLVVEDEPALQRQYPRIVKNLFKGYPVAVFVVDNFDAAVGYLKTHPIKLVISDVDILGEESGIDLFEWVKQHQPHLVDKFVFVTGGNPHVEQMHYRYVEKPATAAQIREAALSVKRIPKVTAAPISAPTTERMPPPHPRPASRAYPVSHTPWAPPPAPAIVPIVPPPAAAIARPRRAGPENIADLAAAVRAVLPQIQSFKVGDRTAGRFGPEKVFISEIWGRLRNQPLFRDMTEAQFKHALVIANRDSLLHLARADLVGAMDPQTVRASEIEDMGASFHFVIDPDANAGGRSWRTTAAPAPAPARAPAPLPGAKRHAAAAPTGGIDLQTFAAGVHRAMERVEQEPGDDGRDRGRFAPEKVFISGIWREAQTDPTFQGMTERQFKRLLVQANAERLVDLARADLVGAMDPDEVRESEIEDMGSTFHFVIDRAHAPRRNPGRAYRGY